MGEQQESSRAKEAILHEIYYFRPEADIPGDLRRRVPYMQVWHIRENGDIHLIGRGGMDEITVSPERFSEMFQETNSVSIAFHEVGKFFAGGVQKLRALFSTAPQKKKE